MTGFSGVTAPSSSSSSSSSSSTTSSTSTSALPQELSVQRQKSSNKIALISSPETKSLKHNLITCTRIHMPAVHANTLSQESPALGGQVQTGCLCNTHEWSETQRHTLLSFLRSALEYSDHVAIAVEECSDYQCPSSSSSSRSLLKSVQDTVNSLEDDPDWSHREINRIVSVIPVKYWGKFTPALNVLLSFAASRGFDKILFQSLEVTVSDNRALPLMMHELDLEDTLVVGASFSAHGHLFHASKESQEITTELNGCTSPWNTMAIWNTSMLVRTGFLAIAEGLLQGVPAGVEEVSVIALQQHLYSSSFCKAKVIDFASKSKRARSPSFLSSPSSLEVLSLSDLNPSHLDELSSHPTSCAPSSSVIEWRTGSFGDDDQRRKWHAQKMQSKLIRPAAQLAALQIPPGRVIHKIVPLL